MEGESDDLRKHMQKTSTTVTYQYHYHLQLNSSGGLEEESVSVFGIGFDTLQQLQNTKETNRKKRKEN